MAILVHMPGDGVRRAHLVVVALTGSAPGVHDRVVVANHSPAVQHVIDCCGTIHDLEDLPLHNDHGVEEATAVGSTCTNARGKPPNRRQASCCHRWSQQIRTSPAHLPGRLPASLRSCHPGKIPVVRKRHQKKHPAVKHPWRCCPCPQRSARSGSRRTCRPARRPCLTSPKAKTIKLE